MSDSLYLECEKFIKENRNRYESLLEEVRGLAAHVKKIDNSRRIYRIYSRGDNKNEDGEFKSTAKVAQKLAKWRKNYNTKSRVEEIHDIIGITIVVHYDSDIPAVYEMIKSNHHARGLKIIPYLPAGLDTDSDDFRQYKKLGYHARHMVFSYSNLGYGGLKCEVQIKTLLHDAWGTKTYDLTYKPAGELPDELRTIMEGFGESIQALEVQSELVRTFITRDWSEENELRRAARISMVSALEQKVIEDEILRDRYRELFQIIQTNQAKLKTCSPNDPVMESLLNQIADLRQVKGGMAAAWPLIMYVASCRIDNQLNHMARRYVEEWVDEALSESADKVFHISSACYVIGERSEAIDLIRKFLKVSTEEQQIVTKLRLNLLYYLIEEAIYASYRAADIRAECDQIMQSLPFEDLSVLPDEIWRYAAIDTKGFYKIVFGETRQEIEEGIRLCQNAYPKGSVKRDGDFGILHERTGWRRYLRARH